MADKIMCGVSNCDYWQDMNCTAERVQVKSNGAEDCSADATFCETFKADKC
ncbi:MAG: DUF1540 domain-containing protein [Bacillota bacterium]|nr:DUF1540 domain-containing protein [Bacillota bacterium]MDW7685049.1 DUF1540 domain-containing protein [Bacillota bacterium]